VTGLSPNAEKIASFLAKTSVEGRLGDPMVTPRDLETKLQLTEEDVQKAVHELMDAGLVHVDGVRQSFDSVWPADSFFVQLDRSLGFDNPVADARRIANEMLASNEPGISIGDLATHYEWTPRRMNPAIQYLLGAHLLGEDIASGTGFDSQQWLTDFLYAEDGLRAFASGRD
jgi:hypothetical protein